MVQSPKYTLHHFSPISIRFVRHINIFYWCPVCYGTLDESDRKMTQDDYNLYFGRCKCVCVVFFYQTIVFPMQRQCWQFLWSNKNPNFNEMWGKIKINKTKISHEYTSKLKTNISATISIYFLFFTSFFYILSLRLPFTLFLYIFIMIFPFFIFCFFFYITCVFYGCPSI